MVSLDNFDLSNNESAEAVNISQYPFPQEIWSVRPHWEVAAKVASLASVVLISITANGCLVHAILRSKSLRATTSNLLILNTAIADFCTSLLCPWMFLGVDVFQNYVLGPFGCKLDGFLHQALTLVAVFSLSALSYDRLCSIVNNCTRKLSIRRARLLILMSWIVALGVAGPLAFCRQYHERQWKNYREKFCAEIILDFPYWHIFVGLSLCTPLLIMAICYTTILLKLNHYERQALKSKNPIAVNYKGKVARILALVVLAFILCRVPFTVLVIQRAEMNQDIKVGQAESVYELWYVSRFLIFVNTALNPLLYGYTSGSLRRELATYSVLSWFIAPKSLRKQNNDVPDADKQDTLQVPPPCIKMDRSKVDVAAPNLSTAAHSQTSCDNGLRACKKLRFSPALK